MATNRRSRLEQAERALQAYRESEGLLNFEERQGLIDQKLSSISTAALNARTERISEGGGAQPDPERSAPSRWKRSPSCSAALSSRALEGELANLQREQAKLSETFGEKHPDMVRVRSEIRTTEDKLRDETRNVKRCARESEYRTAVSQEASLNASLEAAKQEALECQPQGDRVRGLEARGGDAHSSSTRTCSPATSRPASRAS